MKQTFLIRVDSSIKIGTGHVMRCLTLADLLQRNGDRVFFLCRKVEGNLGSIIQERGYKTYWIKSNQWNLENDAQETIEVLKVVNPDWLIIDHYQIDENWERKVYSKVKYIMVIDDLANRKHICDVILDQNFCENYEKRYDQLVSDKTVKLLGPSFLLLREEFYIPITRKNKKQKSLLLFYGGSDPTHETSKALDALEELNFFNINVDVVVGSSNPNREVIKERCLKRNYQYHCQIDYLAEVMKQADLSLGAGGVAMWERCFLGLPSIVTIVAENQRESIEAAEHFGAVWNLGWHKDVKVYQLVDILNRALMQPEQLEIMSKKAIQLMGNKRCCRVHPVIQAIWKFH